MSNRVSDWGRVLLVLLLAGIGSCAPRGKGGGARGGTVANKAVVGEITHDVNKSRCRAVPLERNSCGQNAIENVLRTVLWIIEHGGTPVSGSRNIEIYGTQHLISVSSSNHLKRNTKFKFKFLSVTGTSNGAWPKSSVGGATIILLAVLSGLALVVVLCCCARWIRKKFCKGAAPAPAAHRADQNSESIREVRQPKTRCHLCLKKVNEADYAAVAGMSGHRDKNDSK